MNQRDTKEKAIIKGRTSTRVFIKSVHLFANFTVPLKSG